MTVAEDFRQSLVQHGCRAHVEFAGDRDTHGIAEQPYLDNTQAPFTVVGDSATDPCAAAGALFLGPNDSGVDNNHGEWSVTVTPSG